MIVVGIKQSHRGQVGGSQPYGWQMIDHIDSMTVVPIGEIHLPHWCWCLPAVEKVNGVSIWVHNALDGRE